MPASDKFVNLSDVIFCLKEEVRLADLLRYYGYIRTAESQQILCPFHKENTASAHYYPDNDSLRCFRCNRSWDLIDVYSEKEGVSKAEAVQKLAVLFDVDLSRHKVTDAQRQSSKFYRLLAESKKKQKPPSERKIARAVGPALSKFYEYPWAPGFRSYALGILDYYNDDLYSNSEGFFDRIADAFRYLTKVNASIEEMAKEKLCDE